MLTVGEKKVLTAQDVDFQGRGVCKVDKEIIFVDNLLEKEEALIEITEVKKKIAFAKVLKRHTTSPLRSTYEPVLGSMDLIHLLPKEQLKWQERLTEHTLKKITNQSFVISPIISDEAYFNYRNKVVFHVVGHKPLTLGLYRYRTLSLVKVDDFLLASPIANRILKTIHDQHIMLKGTGLKSIVIRNNQQNEALVTLISKDKEEDVSALVTCLKTIPEVIGIMRQVQIDERNILKGRSEVLFGVNLLTEKVGDDTVFMNDVSFFQTNYGIMKAVYQTILSHVFGYTHAIDAYSGVGSIGFFLAPHFKSITMIDINRDNIDMARRTKRENDIHNVKIECGDVTQKIEGKKAQVLVVDPPRFGLTNDFMKKVIEEPYECLVYLSCDLKSLSSNLNMLLASYDVEYVYPVKMFYQTTEMETLCILKKKPSLK